MSFGEELHISELHEEIATLKSEVEARAISEAQIRENAVKIEADNIRLREEQQITKLALNHAEGELNAAQTELEELKKEIENAPTFYGVLNALGWEFTQFVWPSATYTCKILRVKEIKK